LSCTAGAGVVGTAGKGSSGVDFTLEDDGLLPLNLLFCNEKFVFYMRNNIQGRRYKNQDHY